MGRLDTYLESFVDSLACWDSVDGLRMQASLQHVHSFTTSGYVDKQ